MIVHPAFVDHYKFNELTKEARLTNALSTGEKLSRKDPGFYAVMQLQQDDYSSMFPCTGVSNS